MPGDGRYTVGVEKPADQAEVYVLRDLDSGSEARIIPSLGNNMISFSAGLGGSGSREQIEVLLTPSTQDELRHGFDGFGIPVLFPFPDLVRHGRYAFEGHTYQFPTRQPGAHFGHGFALNRPWSVVESRSTEGATLVSAFRWEDHPDVHAGYPFPFVLTVSYTLAGSAIGVHASAKNVGAGRMPMGFGLHPYFRLPLAQSGRREDCMVRIPSDQKWEVDDELLPSGRVIQAPPERDFHTLRKLGSQDLDDVYTHVELQDGWSESVLVDPAAGVEVAMRADRHFREIVIYAPPYRPTICLEPYTLTTDAVNLQARGVDAGLVILEPGEEWTGEVEIGVRPAKSTYTA